MKFVRTCRMLPPLALLVGIAGILPHAAWAQIERSVGGDGVISISNASSRDRRPAAAGSAASAQIPVLPSDTSSARTSRYDDHIREAATLYRLPEAYLRAVMQVESNYDPRAVSPAGAIGLMQLMPFTAERMMVTDIFEPRQNVLGGARYLRILANTFNGDIHLTTAAYNAGENAVIRYGGIPPYEETQNYVLKVLEKYEQYRAGDHSSTRAVRR